jgi:pyruvate dehydrogenase E2 component (dihydrolipoamide acetyltransferase)
MEVPSPGAGRVSEVLVSVGDKVSEGTAILKLEAQEGSVAEASAASAADTAVKSGNGAADATASVNQASAEVSVSTQRNSPLPPPTDFGEVLASPSVRRLARELEIDLAKLSGTGEKGRITKADVKHALAGASSPAVQGGAGIPEIPAQDFSKFGEVETVPLTRLKKLSGPALHRSWLNVPHVTHSDEADITDLEAYRKTLDSAAKEKGYRVTLISFLMKACVTALKEYPTFNASLAPSKDALIMKKYYHLGVAVDTDDGLVVPVIRTLTARELLSFRRSWRTCRSGCVMAKLRRRIFRVRPSPFPALVASAVRISHRS